MSELLSEQRASTRDNVQRKQARTGGERDDDDEGMAEHESDDSDGDDDNEIPYNPKNLPLGWDGKVRSTCSFLCSNSLESFYRPIILFRGDLCFAVSVIPRNL